jgi:hypothetical protein
VEQYRCCFLTSEGKHFCIDEVDGETKDHALKKIRRRFAELKRFPAFELWLGTTRIYSRPPLSITPIRRGRRLTAEPR